jgi:hypothetical protein
MSAEIENGHVVERDDHLEIETEGGNLDPDREIEREGK